MVGGFEVLLVVALSRAVESLVVELVVVTSPWVPPRGDVSNPPKASWIETLSFFHGGEQNVVVKKL